MRDLNLFIIEENQKKLNVQQQHDYERINKQVWSTLKGNILASSLSTKQQHRYGRKSSQTI
jgi:hypothetical protein